MTSIERSRGLRLALLAAGLFVVGTNAFLIAGVLPDIARSFDVPQTAVSGTITLYAVSVAVLSPLVTTVLPAASRTALMAGGLLIVAVATGGAALAPTLPAFAAARLVAAVGGAALVPTAVAAAPALVPAGRGGRAIAAVSLGFTLATALGAPAGTALAAIGGWRLPLGVLAVVGASLAGLIARSVRGVPTGARVPLGARIALLGHPRTLLVIGAMLLTATGFNAVYIFSASITQAATGGSGSLLALLLLGYGLGGVAGTVVSGRLTDRLGGARVGGAALVVEVVLFALLPVVTGPMLSASVVFVLLGVAAFATTVPIQHRLTTLEPAAAGLALGWYSTALYLGIALAPVLGAAVLAAGPWAVPLLSAGVSALAVVALLLSTVRAPARA